MQAAASASASESAGGTGDVSESEIAASGFVPAEPTAGGEPAGVEVADDELNEVPTTDESGMVESGPAPQRASAAAGVSPSASRSEPADASSSSSSSEPAVSADTSASPSRPASAAGGESGSSAAASATRGGSWRTAFSSLRIPNYRIYFTGQSISLVGTWMQMTAQSWLVLTLTHSSTALGLVVALQALPVLVLGPYGGVIADRADKLRLMTILQGVMGLQALLLGLLTVFGAVRFWEICVLAVFLGVNNAFENSPRQSFIREMVGYDQLRNAITLNSVTVNAARVVGPGVGGILIAAVGVGACFLFNAASFVAVVASLLLIDRGKLRPSRPMPKGRGQLREGLRYAAGTRQIAVPLSMMALVGLLAFEFSVSLPVFVQRTFHGGSEAYGFMTAAMGVGAVVGGLITAAHGRTGIRSMVIASTGFGLAILLCAASPSLVVAYVVMLFTGWASVSFISIGNSTIQLAARPEMRGRVIALWQVAFQGTTPIGGPLVGWIIALTDPRAGLAVGGVACLVAAAGAVWYVRPPLRRGASPRGSDDSGGSAERSENRLSTPA